MEPFSPEDPVFKLLGRARPVKLRPNFTQNVMRAVRQEPQERDTLWTRLERWAGEAVRARLVWAGAGVAMVAALFWVILPSPEPAMVAEAGPVQETVVREVEDPSSVVTTLASEFQSMDQLSLLLAQQDTSSLTDSEIALLLY